MDLVCPSCGTGFAADDGELATQGGAAVCPGCNRQVQAPWSALELDIDTGSGEHPAFDLDFSAEPSPEVAGPVETIDLDGAVAGVSPAAGSPVAPLLDSGQPSVWPDRDDAASAGGAPELSLAGEPPTSTPASPVAELPTSTPSSPVAEPPATRAAGRPAAQRPLSTAGPFAGGPPESTARPPARRAAPVEVDRPTAAHRAVGVSSPASNTWQLFAAVGGTALFAAAVVAVVTLLRSEPPPPPEMPNPLHSQVQAWKEAGIEPTVPTVAEALRAARAGLASGSTRGMREGFEAVRSALLIDPDSAGAVALYGTILGTRPDFLAPEALSDALGAITSVIGADPDTIHRAGLEEARAWLQLRAGRLEAARRAAEAALERAPESTSARLVRAVTRLRTRPAEALEQLAQLRQREESPHSLSLWLGEAQLRTGSLNAALATWERSLTGGPADVAVARRLARLSAAIGDFDDATRRLRRLSEAGWASVEDRITYARLLARFERDSEGALAELDAGLRETGHGPVNRARLIAEKAAVVATARGKTRGADEVSAWLDAALEQAPDLPELLYVAGLLDERAGNLDSAVELLEAANDSAPDRPEVALRLGLVLGADDLPGAQQVVDAGIRETPSYVPLHLLKVGLELEAGRAAGALTALRRALDFDPQRYGKGRELDAFVDPPHAHFAVAKLIGAHVRRSDNPMLVTAVGMAYYFAGDTKRAVQQLNRAARLDPGEVGARLYRAIIGLERNKKALARRDLEAALEADSQHGVVRFYQARLLEMSGKHGEAERVYLDLLDRNPLDGAARVGLARTLQARKERRQAIEQAVKVLGSRPNDRDALRFLAHAERRRGRRRR